MTAAAITLVLSDRLVQGTLLEQKSTEIDGLPATFFRVAIVDSADRKAVECAIGHALDDRDSAWFTDAEVQH